MPELPEVETVRRSLEERTVGSCIRSLDILFPGCVQGMAPQQFAHRLVGRQIDGWLRKGKYLIGKLDDASCFSVHLRMTGQITIGASKEESSGPYTRVIITLDDGRVIRFDDQRKFGRLCWYPDEYTLDTTLALGPDPTDDKFRPKNFMALLKGRKRSVKSLLLDQKIIAGVGNIYADEALFRAGIHPGRPSGEIRPDEAETLWKALRDVLHEGSIHRGTSIRDYVDSDGRRGGFQEHLRVYGRVGKPCNNCATPIIRIKLSGRSSFHCPHCQT